MTTKNTLKKKKEKNKNRPFFVFLLTKKGYKDYNKKDNVIKQFKQKKEKKTLSAFFCLRMY